jgi:hypothetical protein
MCPNDIESAEVWPELPYAAWKDTCTTLHLWTQVVGKIRLAQTPWLNHGWHVVLYVTPRGLTTSSIPHGNRAFELEFDLVNHQLHIRTSDGPSREIRLEPKSVADFYAEVMAALAELKLAVHILELPSEVADPIRFSDDHVHAAYDPHYARRFARVLVQVDRVFKQFRTGFLGKTSPVHFFWGAFDLAVTRFSGRRAPLHPGGIPHMPDNVTREAYSHEVSSAGFWPGGLWPGGGEVDAAFYSYAYPEPPGFRAASVRPEQASFDAKLGEFMLPYASVCSAADPDRVLSDFLQSTYEAAANAAGWERSALECAFGRPGVPRPVP